MEIFRTSPHMGETQEQTENTSERRHIVREPAASAKERGGGSEHLVG